MAKYKDENGTTRVGDWLRSLGDIGKPILAAAGDLTGQAWLGVVADKIRTSSDIKEGEKNFALELLKLDRQDLADARNHNIKIQESDNASWMAKNVPYIFDAFILLIWGFMTVYLVLAWIGIIKASENADMTGILGIYSGVSALAMAVIQYHRGSSSGSKLKTSLMGG